MVKRGFKMGGNGKSVMTVPEYDASEVVEAGTMPAVTVGEAPTVTLEAGSIGVDEQGRQWGIVGGDVSVSADAIVPGAPVSDLIDAALIDVVGAEVVYPAGWRVVETSVADNGPEFAGSAVLNADGAVVDVLAFEPDVVNVLQALRADDDGMGAMLAVAGEPVPDVSPVAALIAAFKPIEAQPVTGSDDYVICTMRMDLETARYMAQVFADKLGSPMKVALSVDGFGRGADSFFPGMGKRSAAALRMPRVAKVTEGKVAAEPKAERDWLAFDGVAQWGDNPAPYAKGYIKVWQKVTAMGVVGDLDGLLAEDFAGSHDDGRGNSGQQMNGKVLRAWIAKVRADLAEREAALDNWFSVAA